MKLLSCVAAVIGLAWFGFIVWAIYTVVTWLVSK